MIIDDSLLRNDLTEVEKLKYKLLTNNVLAYLEIYINTPLMMGSYDERVAGIYHMGNLTQSLLGQDTFSFKTYFQEYVLNGWSNNIHRNTPKGEMLLSNAVEILKSVCLDYIKFNYFKKP